MPTAYPGAQPKRAWPASWIRPAASVAERAERRHDLLAAHRAHDGEQIPFVLLFARALSLHQEGGVLVDGGMVLPPFRLALHGGERATAGHQGRRHLARV